MRRIDLKHHVDGDQIIKTGNGQPIPEEEPLVLFRARDYLVVRLLEHYRKLCEVDGCNEFQLEGVDELIDRFSRFAVEHPERMKQPGITRGL